MQMTAPVSNHTDVENAMDTNTPIQWEAEIAQLLDDLSAVQSELLELLDLRREYMVSGNNDGMNSLLPKEADLSARLQACQDRRLELLQLAKAQGLPGDSIQDLAHAVTDSKTSSLGKEAKSASSRMRLLQHNSLTNWVVAQQSLLHLSQLLEIIATGGRLQPTYGKDSPHKSGGALVDEAA